jgi:DNA topoisomerase 2-associated protein PAT1
MRYAAQHAPGRLSPVKKERRPIRHGYENIPSLEVDADIWGLAPKKEVEQPRHAAEAPAQSRKALTLEEVEAMMLAQSSQPQQNLPPPSSMQQPFPGYPPVHQQQYYPPEHQYQQQPPQSISPAFPSHPQILQRPPGQQQLQPQTAQAPPTQSNQGYEQNQRSHRHPQILQRQQNQSESPQQQPQSTGQKQQRQPPAGQQQQAPRQILQNPNRLSGQGQPLAYQRQSGPQDHYNHGRGPSYSGPIITNPQQILQLSEEERAVYLQEEARRAKRNHKIHLLSKYNGLMTPQDKNFITRIQLQQLVTATGSVDSEGPESLLTEDFYYQVYTQIRGAPRTNPHQPANQFAQTYLYATGGRYGQGRRQPRGGDNHMQRMEQQVQRAVEAARAKPKNKQLVIEGSLGKISFSNAKTPKPLLNIKRFDSEPSIKRVSRSHDAAEERRRALKNIEKVYGALMEIEDHARLQPLEDSSMYEMWASKNASLNEKLWFWLKAYEPIVEK